MGKNNPDLQIFIIGQTNAPFRKDGNIWAKVIDYALMMTSARYIPIDSSHECKIENKLYEEGRSFIKPLRFDCTEEITHPDFILTDVENNSRYILEVFGMNTAEYNARKNEKIAYYDEEYGHGNWWYWDATEENAEDNIPAFPSMA